MQPHHQINHTNVNDWTVLTTVTLASSNCTLPDDGDYTETCWRSFNINFNTSFKAVLLCISWCTNFDSTKMHGTTVKKIQGSYFPNVSSNESMLTPPVINLEIIICFN
jgi:hypothetical protein